MTTSLTDFERTILQRHATLQARVDEIPWTRETEEEEIDADAFVKRCVKNVLTKTEKKEPPEQETDLPDTYELRNVDATVQLQRVKLHDLETRLQSLQDVAKEKEGQLQETRREIERRTIDDEKRKEHVKKLQTETEKLKNERTRLEHQFESSKGEIRELKKRVGEYEKEKRQLEAMTRTKEIRQKRLNEEMDRCKAAMESLKLRDRDSRDATKKDAEQLTAENKKLQRQKSELVVALHKQMKLIDVLKRQNAHMEAAKLLSFTESEFEKIISFNTNNTPTQNHS